MFLPFSSIHPNDCWKSPASGAPAGVVPSLMYSFWLCIQTAALVRDPSRFVRCTCIPADAVIGVPTQLRDLRIAQEGRLDRVDDGAVKIEAPVSDPRKTGAAVASFSPGRALLRSAR